MNDFLSLSKYYDLFMENNGVEKWKNYVVKSIIKYAKGKNGIDVGCGTGAFTRALKENGFSVMGVDFSSAMLNEAYSYDDGIIYIQKSITDLKGFKELDFVTAINDVINYVPPKKLKKAFTNVYNSLKTGGIFMFDISSSYKLVNIIGNNFFTEDEEDVTYLWANKMSDEKVVMDMTFFIRDNDKYIRKDESYTEYIYSISDIEQNLKETGFHIIKEEGHTGKKLLGDSERINFIVKKV